MTQSESAEPITRGWQELSVSRIRTVQSTRAFASHSSVTWNAVGLEDHETHWLLRAALMLKNDQGITRARIAALRAGLGHLESEETVVLPVGMVTVAECMALLVAAERVLDAIEHPEPAPRFCNECGAPVVPGPSQRP